MRLESERLRAWVYDSLLRTHQELGIGSQPLSLNAISNWVKQKAQQSGLLPHLPAYFDVITIVIT
jgi:hypothetical protein